MFREQSQRPTQPLMWKAFLLPDHQPEGEFYVPFTHHPRRLCPLRPSGHRGRAFGGDFDGVTRHRSNSVKTGVIPAHAGIQLLASASDKQHAFHPAMLLEF